MGKIISVFNVKGGCGKTTIALNLAKSIQEDGYSVRVIDIDDQEAAMSIAKLGNLGFPVSSDLTLLPTFREDVLIFDHKSTVDSSKLPTNVVEMVIVPIMASPLDIAAWGSTKRLLRNSGFKNSLLSVLIIDNDKELANLGKELAAELSMFNSMDGGHVVGRSNVYVSSLSFGKTAFDMQSDLPEIIEARTDYWELKNKIYREIGMK